MSSSGEASPVRVMIFGEEYQIRTHRPESHTRACARYVDDAIQRAHVRGVAEPHRAAILAALQITDELLEERSDAEALAQTVEVRLVELTARLEALAGAGAAVEATSDEASGAPEADPA